MTRRRLTSIGLGKMRELHLSAIAIALDAQSIQRKAESEFTITTTELAAMTGRAEYLVRRLVRDHFQSIKVRGRVVGYNLGTVYVADNEATDRIRHPERYVTPDPLSRADTIGNLPGYHDGETWIVAGA